MGGGAGDRRRDCAAFVRRVRSAVRSRLPDRRRGCPQSASRGHQRLGAVQPARGAAADRAPVPGPAPGGAAPHSGNKDAAAQSSPVGASAERALRGGRTHRLEGRLRPVATGASRAQSVAGGRSGDERRDRGEDRERAVLSAARLRDADAGARGRPCGHRPLFRPPGALGRGGACRARARRRGCRPRRSSRCASA